MSLVRFNEPGALLSGPKEDEVQAEGCPVKTDTFPLPVTQTEISLDIGSPSFHYVDDENKVSCNNRVFKARYMNKHEISLPDHLEVQLESLVESSGRSKGEIVTNAVETYLLARTRWNVEMDKAMADAKSGLGYEGEEVLAWMESWGDGQEKPTPGVMNKSA